MFQYLVHSLWKKLYLNKFGLEEADLGAAKLKQLYYVKATSDFDDEEEEDKGEEENGMLIFRRIVFTETD